MKAKPPTLGEMTTLERTMATMNAATYATFECEIPGHLSIIVVPDRATFRLVFETVENRLKLSGVGYNLAGTPTGCFFDLIHGSRIELRIQA